MAMLPYYLPSKTLGGLRIAPVRDKTYESFSSAELNNICTSRHSPPPQVYLASVAALKSQCRFR